MKSSKSNRRPVQACLLCLFLSLGLFQLGCPKGHVRPGGASDYETAQELLQALGNNKLQSLRVSGTVEMRKEGQRIKAHMIYLTRRPALLRFETESFFDQPLSILVSDGKTFSAWDMQKGRFVRGAASSANISRVIPVPMDGATVAGMLMGDPPLSHAQSASLDWDSERGAYRVQVETGSTRQQLWVAPEPLRTVELRLENDGQRVYQIFFEDWIEKKGRAIVAGKIVLEAPGQEIRLRIKIREAEADPELADDLFSLQPPDGVAVETW